MRIKKSNLPQDLAKEVVRAIGWVAAAVYEWIKFQNGG